MALSHCSVENVVNKAVIKLGLSLVKPQQMMAINEFINGRDVFMILPTGFGKAVCFTCLPNCYERSSFL